MKKQVIFSIILFILLTAVVGGYAGVQAQSNGMIPEWHNLIGSDTTDNLSAAIQTADGGYLLGGTSAGLANGDKTIPAYEDGFFEPREDYWVVKLDVQGNIQWQKVIGSTYDDVLTCLIQTSDGGYLIGGYSASDASFDKTENSLGNYDYWIVKLDAAGNIEWDNTIGGDGQDMLRTMIQTADGGFLLGGDSRSNISGDKTENCFDTAGWYDYWVVKLSPTGQVIEWQITLGGNNFEYLTSVLQTTNGGYVIGGYSRSGVSGNKTLPLWTFVTAGSDFWVVWLDPTGNIQFQRRYGSCGDDHLYAMQQTTDGGFIFAGSTNNSCACVTGNQSEYSGNEEYWVVKTDDNGFIQWNNMIRTSSGDRVRAIRQTDDGYLIAGESGAILNYPYPNINEVDYESRGGYDLLMMKLDNTGEIEWQSRFGGAGDETVRSMVLTADGGCMVAGNTTSPHSGDLAEGINDVVDPLQWPVPPVNDYYIVKYKQTATVSGRVYYDANANGVYNPGETLLPNSLINVQQGTQNHLLRPRTRTGRYWYVAGPGAVSVSSSVPAYPSLTLNSTPATYNLNFANDADSAHNINFGYILPPGLQDLRLWITPLTGHRPGFESHYRVTVQNLGGTAQVPSFTLDFEDSFTFLNSSVVLTPTGNNSFTYNGPSLAPFATQEFTVRFTATGVLMGDTVYWAGTVAPTLSDATPTNNTVLGRGIVVASCDPNDKLANNGIEIAPNYFAVDTSEHTIDYTVRFQNTGTAPAMFVVIKDTLDVTKLNPATFNMISASHDYTWEIDQQGIITWTFMGINLADSATNEPASHGFVRFLIDRQPGTNLNDVIENQVAIFFDYNDAVITEMCRIILSGEAIEQDAAICLGDTFVVADGFYHTLAGTYLDTVITAQNTLLLVTTNLETVAGAPVITTQPPASFQVCQGTPAFLTIGVTGPELEFQWQVYSQTLAEFVDLEDNVTFTGTNSDSLEIDLSTATNSSTFRCVISNLCSPAGVISSNSTIYIGVPPVITAQPQPDSVCGTGLAQFSVAVSTYPVTYRWQIDSGFGFVNLSNGAGFSGTTSANLSATSLAYTNGDIFRCVISSGVCPVVYTNPALLTTFIAPSISALTANQNVCSGDTTSFTVSTTPPTVNFQWQYFNGSAFVNIVNGGIYSGATTPTLTVSGVPVSPSSYSFRCVISNGNCTPINTLDRTLTVSPSPTITTQPTPKNVCAGANTNFTVAATGASGVYQWQVNTGSGWTNIPAGAPYSGTTGATLSIAGTPAGLNGNLYRCRVGSCQKASNSASLTVGTPISIGTQPASQSTCNNGPASFSVATGSSGVSYQWQVNTGSGFVNISNGGVYSGATSASLTLSSTAGANGYLFRCVLSNACGTVNSASAPLAVSGPTSITQNLAICSGQGVTVGNNTYTTPGTYTDVLTTANGCDSTITTHITVGQPNSFSQSLTICQGESVTVGTSTYTTPGTHTTVLTNASGCDSTVTTNLTVLPNNNTNFAQTICQGESITIGGNTYTTTGNYTNVLTNAAGCDSTVTLQLFVMPIPTRSQTLTICAGESVTVYGSTYTQAGTYQNTVAMPGCDSIVTTEIIVAEPDTAVTLNAGTLTATATTGTFQWLNCSTGQPVVGETAAGFTPVLTGEYAVAVTVAGCTDTSDCYPVLVIGRADALLGGQLRLYPNPSTGQVMLELEWPAVGSQPIQVFDALGRAVDAHPVPSNATHQHFTLNVAGLSAGVYTVRVETTQGVAVARLIRQ